MSLDQLGQWIMNLLGDIFSLIIFFLSKLVIICVNILIQFASYNNFVNSQVVQTGWPLVRDIVNMFFIVVILVTAFSTIIQYRPGEFHYSKVLPKLLVMAILINFSKTLLGLLIDFSQVVMLTFVNAFKQAAGANFISALHLTEITKLDTTLSDAGKANQTTTELIVATLLGIVMLGISLTILIIMIGFIVFRIIGLWLLLIISPIAFFALALPGKLQKGLDAFTNKFWSKLSTLLIAGPVMAFFLWLALAIAQQSSNAPFADLYNNSNTADAADAANAAGFVSVVGNPGNIASFIVVIALLLEGVQFAVQSAGAISPSLGKFAQQTARGGGAAVHLARGAARLTAGTARVAGRAARTGFEGVDRLADVRGTLGRAGMAVSARTGGAGMATFAGMAAHRGERIRTRQGEITKAIAGLDAGTRDTTLRAMADSKVFGRQAQAAQLALADSATSGLAQKALTGRFMEKAKKDYPNLSAAEQQAYAESLAAEQRGKDLKAGQALAGQLGYDEKADKYGDAFKKDPSMNTDWASFAATKGAAIEDVKKHLGDIPTASWKDGRFALAEMSAMGLVNSKGEIAARTEENKETWNQVMKGDRGKYVDAHMDKWAKDKTGVAAQLAVMEGDQAQVALANASRTYAAKDKTGNFASVLVNQGGAQVQVAQTFDVRQESKIDEAKARLANAAAGSEAATIARGDMLASGATLKESHGFDTASGKFADETQRGDFSKAMGAMGTELSKGSDKGIEVVMHLDTESLRVNPNGSNEARTAAFAKVGPDMLQNGLQKAIERGNSEAERKIRDLANMMVAESKRVERELSKANIAQDQVSIVASNPTSGAAIRISDQMKIAGISDPVQYAQAAVNVRSLSSNPNYSAVRSTVGNRAVAATRKAGGRKPSGGGGGGSPSPASAPPSDIDQGNAAIGKAFTGAAKRIGGKNPPPAGTGGGITV